jgi:RNA polymerase sigma factor (sigma-70 family)
MITQQVEQAIAEGFCEGHMRHGDLGLDSGMYAERIRNIVQKHLASDAGSSRAVEFVKALYHADLYLATACAKEAGEANAGGEAGNGRSPAWERFTEEYTGCIEGMVGLYWKQSAEAREMASNILTDLFFPGRAFSPNRSFIPTRSYSPNRSFISNCSIPNRSGVSRIVFYDGRSSLAAWLRVMVCSKAGRARRTEEKLREAPAAGHSRIAAFPAMERMMIAGRYEKRLASALFAACGKLSESERMALLWRYEYNMPLRQIAASLGTRSSRVEGHLREVRRKLRDSIICSLSRQDGMSGRAIAECLQDMVENPYSAVSLLDCLKDSGMRRKPPTGDRRLPARPRLMLVKTGSEEH